MTKREKEMRKCWRAWIKKRKEWSWPMVYLPVKYSQFKSWCETVGNPFRKFWLDWKAARVIG